VGLPMAARSVRTTLATRMSRPIHAERTRVLFTLAVGVVAAQAVVDGIVAPQRGTSSSDHLVAVLAAIVVVTAAVLAYGRLCNGARAIGAAALGVLAVEGAVVSAVGAARPTARLADWTGLALGPAGLALLSLAAALLWRSRRSCGHPLLRRLLLALAAALGTFWILLPLGLALLATHRPRAPVSEADLGRAYRSVTLRTADRLDLAAWYVPSRNGAAVISFPTRAGKLDHARMLVRNGYGVLLVDMRGYDGSDGAPNAFGWGATADIDAAVAWLQRQPDVRGGRIGGIGFSVGGEQMLEAAADNPGLRAVVSEGAGERSVRESLIRGARGWFMLPADAVQTAAVAVLSDTVPPPSIRDVVARIAPRPTLFVYAADGAGGEDLTPSYYRAAKQPKAIWRIPDGGHTGGLAARPAEYERRVVGFFDHALLGLRRPPST
jgi:hypothetical protein